jgi:hypothetical protein
METATLTFEFGGSGVEDRWAGGGFCCSFHTHQRLAEDVDGGSCGNLTLNFLRFAVNSHFC